MADIAVRSQQNIHGGGVGYKPTNTKPTARYTVTKSIQKTSDTLATVTMVITIKTNYEFVAVGLGETLTYQLFIDGVQRGSVVLKTASQTMNASGTYTRTLVARNVPLDHRTTQPANLRLVNDKRSDWEFNSNTQGGDQIVGLPIGIQRSNFSSFSGFTVIDGEVSFNATVTRVSSGTTHDVALLHGTTSIATWTGQGNFTSLSLTQAQSRVLLNHIKTSTTATVSLRVQTVHGGSVLYTQTRSATVTVGVTPSIGSVTVSDSSGALSDVGALVQGVSNITLSINSVSAGYGATISSYGHNWSNISEWTTSATKVAGTITRSGDIPYTGRVRNSRGQLVSLKTTETVLPWSTPRSTSVQVQRCTSNGTIDPAGSYIRVTGSHSVSPLTVGGVNKNTLRVLVRYRVANTSTWTNALNKTYPAGTVSTNESHTLGGGALDPTKTYDFEVIAYDRYASTSVTGLIPTERVLMSRVRNETVGFGKIGERGIIDAKGDVYIDGDLEVEGSNLVSRIEALEANIDLLHLRRVSTRYTVSTQAELDDVLDTVGLSVPAHAFYIVSVSINVGTLSLTGGTWLVEGVKTSVDYEWQTAKTYVGGGLFKKRVKTAGTWKEWSDI